MSPREIAKDLIRPYVNNESVEHLAASYLGTASSDYWAQIGGYAVLTHGEADPKKWQSTKLSRYQIAVTKIDGKECLHIFSLKELYQEIKQGEQLELF